MKKITEIFFGLYIIPLRTLVFFSILHVIKVLLSVTDWYSRDLEIDPIQYRF
jgi:hypothetical protein